MILCSNLSLVLCITWKTCLNFLLGPTVSLCVHISKSILTKRFVSGPNSFTSTNTVFSKHFYRALAKISIIKLPFILLGWSFWIQGPCVRLYQPTEGYTRRQNCKRVWLSWSSSTLDSDEEFKTDGITWNRWSKVGLHAF